MNYDIREVERIAEGLCVQRHGKDSWIAPHRKKEAYRQAARKIIAKGRGIVTADALMLIFGFRRVK